MRDNPNQSSRPGGVRRWTSRLLILAGTALLAWSAVLVIDASHSQEAARQAFERRPRLDASAYLRQPIATASTHLRVPLVNGAAVAELQIPRVELSSVVLEGSDALTLRRGPGHLETTPLPGESGNVVIAGHRDTFFRPLRNVKIGDDVFIETSQDIVHYQVASLHVVSAHDLRVLEPTGEDTLTLITCFPFWVLGPAPDRFVVRAIRVGEPRRAWLPTGAIPITFSAHAPSIEHPPARPELGRAAPVVYDDETLVRAAIERFRLIYNGRLISHNEARTEGLLRFSTCALAMDGDLAIATCDTTEETEDGQPPALTLSLQRSDGAWAIRSTSH